MFTTIINCLQWPQNLIAAIGIKDKNGEMKMWDMSDDQIDGLMYVLDQLTERERVIVYYRFLEEQTLKQIADTLGISVTRVQQLITKSIDVLRQPYYADYYMIGLQQYQIIKTKKKEEILKEKDFHKKMALLNNIPLDKVDITIRTRKGLKRANINNLGDIVRLLDSNPGTLIQLSEIGIKSVAEIIHLLEDYGLDCSNAKSLYGITNKDVSSNSQDQ